MWNEGARLLSDERGSRETVEAFAERIGLERTYCGRLLSGERTPGMTLRLRLGEEFRIPLDAWNKSLPYPEKPAKPAA
jgi:hypothetical protein